MDGFFEYYLNKLFFQRWHTAHQINFIPAQYFLNNFYDSCLTSASLLTVIFVPWKSFFSQCKLLADNSFVWSVVWKLSFPNLGQWLKNCIFAYLLQLRKLFKWKQIFKRICCPYKIRDELHGDLGNCERYRVVHMGRMLSNLKYVHISFKKFHHQPYKKFKLLMISVRSNNIGVWNFIEV